MIIVVYVNKNLLTEVHSSFDSNSLNIKNMLISITIKHMLLLRYTSISYKNKTLI